MQTLKDFFYNIRNSDAPHYYNASSDRLSTHCDIYCRVGYLKPKHSRLSTFVGTPVKFSISNFNYAGNFKSRKQ